MENCSICKRIEMIQNESNPFFIKETKTGYAVFADHQQFHGTVYFYSKKHVACLDELDDETMKDYLFEMAQLQKAIRLAFGSDHVDCELIGTDDHHLHFQLFPRMDQDLPLYGENGNGPVYWCPKSCMFSSDNFPSQDDLAFMKKCLNQYL